jgi:hypothetical protein
MSAALEGASPEPLEDGYFVDFDAMEADRDDCRVGHLNPLHIPGPTWLPRLFTSASSS